jgi:hypothetical protein
MQRVRPQGSWPGGGGGGVSPLGAGAEEPWPGDFTAGNGRGIDMA